MGNNNCVLTDFESGLREYALHLDPSDLINVIKEKGRNDNSYIKLLLEQLLKNENSIKAFLADEFETGKVVWTNIEKAKALFEAAYAEGDMYGAYSLAWLYYNQKEYVLSIEFFQKCINNIDKLTEKQAGSTYATIGDAYTRLGNPEYHKAIECLTIGSEKYKEGYAGRRLAQIYRERDLNGIYDLNKSVSYYRKAMEDGDVKAAIQLADFYLIGEPEINIEENRDSAIRILERFFDTKDPGIYERVGTAYLFKCGNDEPDYDLAIEYFDKAIEYNNGYFYEGELEQHLGYAHCMSSNNLRGLELLEFADSKGYSKYSGIIGNAYYDSFDDYRHHDYKKAAYYYQHAYDYGVMNLYQLANFMELLASDDPEICNYRLAYKIAEEGIAEHNDVVFFRTKAMLVLKGRVSNEFTKLEAAQLLEELKGYDALKKEDYRLLGQFFWDNNQFRKAEMNLIEAFKLKDADAGLQLARLYENGGGTIAADVDKAVTWYRNAAELGSEEAQKELSNFAEKIFGGYRRIRR